MQVGACGDCLQRIERWSPQIESTSDDELVSLVRPLLQRWLASDDRSILQLTAPLIFGRGDPNLANCLWDGLRMRFIDLESAGWSDLAFELADLVEHINSRSISDSAWRTFVGQLLPSDVFAFQPFQAAQRTCALLWLVILWSHRGQRRSSLLAQIERVQCLRA